MRIGTTSEVFHNKIKRRNKKQNFCQKYFFLSPTVRFVGFHNVLGNEHSNSFLHESKKTGMLKLVLNFILLHYFSMPTDSFDSDFVS